MKTYNKEKIFNLCSNIFFAIILITQTIQILLLYLAGKTMVNIEVAKISNDVLPAITICYPFIISIEGCAQLNSTYQHLLNKYQDELKHYYKNDTYFDKIIEDQLMEYYYEVNQLLTLIPIQTIINNMSINFWIKTNQEMYKAIQIHIEGIIDDQNELVNRTLKYVKEDALELIIDPIESLDPLNSRKCFTFFSSLQLAWRDFKLGLKEINISVRHNRLWFPTMGQKVSTEELPSPSMGVQMPMRQTQYKTYLAIHSPNSLPEFNEDSEFIEVESDRQYFIRYSKLSIERLNSRYDTNCQEYDLDHKYGNYSMMSDCISSCHQRLLTEYCPGNLFKNIPFLFRKEYFELDNMSRIDLGCSLNYHAKKLRMRIKCSNICKYDCRYTYYSLDYSSKKVQYRSSFNPSIINILRIRHKSFPDIVVRHLPETTFIALVCNFGGLMGMWLGISFSKIFIDLSKIIINPRKINVKNYFIDYHETEQGTQSLNYKSSRVSISNDHLNFIPNNLDIRRISINNLVK